MSAPTATMPETAISEAAVRSAVAADLTRIGDPSSVASMAFCTRWFRIVSTRPASAIASKPGEKSDSIG